MQEEADHWWYGLLRNSISLFYELYEIKGIEYAATQVNSKYGIDGIYVPSQFQFHEDDEVIALVKKHILTDVNSPLSDADKTYLILFEVGI